MITADAETRVNGQEEDQVGDEDGCAGNEDSSPDLFFGGVGRASTMELMQMLMRAKILCLELEAEVKRIPSKISQSEQRFDII